MSYPKWVSRGYGLGDILCRDKDEEDAVLNPAAADEATGEGEPTVEELRAKLDALGIKYHPNAGVKKLQALLPAD